MDNVHWKRIQSISLKCHVVTYIELNHIFTDRLMGCAIRELKKGCSDSEVQADIGASYEELQEAHDFFCLVSFNNFR